LTPNWKHLPIGYHGRAGTVVVTGTDVIRPRGQAKAPEASAPTFGASGKLDLEAELGWVVGVGSVPGVPVPVSDFRDHVFGVVILNDWSARDLQAWEYVPLGPFLAKSFATSISAWVLPLAALDDARVELPDQQPELSPYLQGHSTGYDIDVRVEINGRLVSTCPHSRMYYSPAQMMAHLTVNGAHLRTGDLYGSGTISGPARDQRGSLLELSWNGSQPVPLGDGSTRTFLADGDEVVLRAVSRGANGARLGEVRGRVQPSLTT
jgi:fumarylacetoacetase